MVAVGLVDHLERHLGEIEVGWSRDADGFTMPFQVVRFAPPPLAGFSVFSTLGLSEAVLASRRSDKLIRHEFVMIVPDRLRDGPVPAILQQAAVDIVASGSALLRGDVISPQGPLFATSRMEALYAAIPVFMSDDFGACGDVVLVWLVPISRKEAEFVEAKGWPAFENLLVDVDPDLTDPYRPALFV